MVFTGSITVHRWISPSLLKISANLAKGLLVGIDSAIPITKANDYPQKPWDFHICSAFSRENASSFLDSVEEHASLSRTKSPINNDQHRAYSQNTWAQKDIHPTMEDGKSQSIPRAEDENHKNTSPKLWEDQGEMVVNNCCDTMEILPFSLLTRLFYFFYIHLSYSFSFFRFPV